MNARVLLGSSVVNSRSQCTRSKFHQIFQFLVLQLGMDFTEDASEIIWDYEFIEQGQTTDKTFFLHDTYIFISI